MEADRVLLALQGLDVDGAAGRVLRNRPAIHEDLHPERGAGRRGHGRGGTDNQQGGEQRE